MANHILFFIKKIILKILSVSILFLYPFLILMRRWRFIRFGYLQTSRIGGFSIEAEIYLNDMNKNNFYDFISSEYSDDKLLSNSYLFGIIKRNIKIFKFVKINRFIINSISLWFKDSPHIIKFRGHPTYYNNIIDNKKNFLHLSSYDIDIVKRNLNIKNFNINSKWICLHNRDSGYLSYFLGNKQNWKYHDYRDFSILSFEEIVNFFLSKDFFVFRIGNFSNQFLNIHHPKYIDLNKDKNKNDLFHLFIINNCEYFLGNNSGPSNIATLFNKPILMTNYTEIRLLDKLNKLNYVVIFKLFFDTKKNKFLSLNEIFSNNYDRIYTTENLIKNNLKLIENSSDEILNATKELEDVTKKKKLEIINLIFKFNFGIFLMII